ncbi:MAG: hypothetical protein EZS28_023027 [Streblomastix strix]|uniref:Uncharacterized protein n=1 Tax=Streblomastix strix TaxID=222440 RepID=A0A5J4VFT7_9EUKA|nr:MAG: hypothetical protein EZS28_023027 [Streblomastix strix]
MQTSKNLPSRGEIIIGYSLDQKKRRRLIINDNYMKSSYDDVVDLNQVSDATSENEIVEARSPMQYHEKSIEQELQGNPDPSVAYYSAQQRYFFAENSMMIS